MAVALQNAVPNPILALADQLLAIRNEQDELDARIKELNKQEEVIERQLFEMMVNEEVEKFTRNGKTFAPTVRTYASIKAECKEATFAWLKENGYGDLVKEQVNANSLTSLYKEMDESGELPEEFSDMLNVYQKQSVVIRKGRN